ncbi:MAG: DUF3131 domain-containing protein, partial [Clostridia bacterium]|nr:DUF3131 domain-containing protein [Clostridia bacterium]
ALIRRLNGRTVPTLENPGTAYIVLFAGLFLAISAIAVDLCGWFLAVPALFVVWRYAKRVLDFIITTTVKPRALLKLEFRRVPDEHRTLVVIPALLTSVKRARELAAQLEALGAATRQDAIEYLLLGDFKDAGEQSLADDDRIVIAAQTAIDEINARDGGSRFHYLHRKREWVANDGRWMAKERKRGALMELNELLLGGSNGFGAYDKDAEALRGRFKYVLTLDADARLLPEAQRALIGAMAHPLNRRRVENGVVKGFSVISPRVEQTVKSRFAGVISFPGGLDAYPAAASSAYWDMCRQAVFCGKGIYNIRDFHSQLEGVMPEYAILSHDLLEGALTGAGLASDVVVLDDFPSTPAGFLKRLHRWTRGDWQLLPFIFTLPIPALGRFMMLDNLVSSLSDFMALVLIIVSMWLGLASPAIIALLGFALGALFAPASALGNLAMLPSRAATGLDAAIRAIYRVYRSRRNLLEWTPAYDSEGSPGDDRAGKIAAILLLPGLFHGPFAPFAAAIGLVFWAGENKLYSLDDKKPVPDERKKKLFELACVTWRYFEEIMPADGNGLVPDNLQTDPPAGPARRTSPTNIAMYMLSCLSAANLGIIKREEAEDRIGKTLAAIEGLEKWRGQLYNWYDTDTGLALNPKYVSSVDSGNLAAGLLLIAAVLKGELGERCEKLADAMELYALYDEKRELFRIGVDTSSGKFSDSHYDLLASESRILSLVAIALGQVPAAHWLKLGRQLSGKTLISWSGTVFEYLMPELFTRSHTGTLLYESNLSLVRSRAGEIDGIWGVSESGYYAFDSRMNYQYRAFGLNGISYRGGGDGKVIAPYATLL